MCLLGTFTHIQRRSGANGFILGVVDGLGRLVCPDLKPGILTDKYTAYFFTILATAGTMIIGSLAMGWQMRGELLHAEKDGWLPHRQLEVYQAAISEKKCVVTRCR